MPSRALACNQGIGALLGVEIMGIQAALMIPSELHRALEPFDQGKKQKPTGMHQRKARPCIGTFLAPT